MTDLLTGNFIEKCRAEREASEESAMFGLMKTKQGCFTGCTPPTASQRMAAYSKRHAEETRMRENMGAAAPVARVVDGRAVLVALPGKPNKLPLRKPSLPPP